MDKPVIGKASLQGQGEKLAQGLAHAKGSGSGGFCCHARVPLPTLDGEFLEDDHHIQFQKFQALCPLLGRA